MPQPVNVPVQAATLAQIQAQLACDALQRLVDCPDLNLDELEPETVAALEQARAVLKIHE